MGPRQLMVLDSAGLWFRAFHSVPERITGPDAHPMNAVRGFCEMTATLVEEYRPAALVAALDRSWRPDWRVELIGGYKAHRVADDGGEQTPDSLDGQVPVIVELLHALGVTTAAAVGYEADDVIAHYAGSHRPTVVVTGDRDLLQLASPSASVLYVGAGMRRRHLYSPADVLERFALPVGPDAGVYADYAVLVGDASDGLPGIAGIGAKTAAALLGRHGDLDGIIAAAEDPASDLGPRQREALMAGRDYLLAARQVVRLGGRELDLEIVGDPGGRRGPVDDAIVQEMIVRTGQGRAVGRLVSALDVLGTD